jgi:hypothetical protein
MSLQEISYQGTMVATGAVFTLDFPAGFNQFILRNRTTLAAGAGVNGALPNAFMHYDTVADVITITVHPSPTTGPIYHIVGTWAQ